MVPRVLDPRPTDDGLVWIKPKQAGYRLAIAVPQLRPSDRPAQCTNHNLTYHGAARKPEPDHRVRTRPDQVPDRRVVAVDHPAIARHDGLYASAELLSGQRLPAWPMVDRVQLNERYRELTRKCPAERRLPRTGVAHHRHPSHATTLSGTQSRGPFIR